MQLRDMTILVTGGASGLGAACVRHFAARGARLLIADVNEPAGKALSEELGDTAAFAATDVTSPEEVQAAIEAAVEHFGGLQGNVNCAGILGAGRVLGREGPLDLETFRRVLDVNLTGTLNVLRLAANHMQQNSPDAAGERGVIINTSSVAAWEGQIGQAAYSASKGGVAAMTLPIAREFARIGIRVVSIAPGVFRTPMVEAMPEKVQDSLQSQTMFPPRLGQPDEFAALAQHIFENAMCNGSAIRLDGAVRLGPK